MLQHSGPNIREFLRVISCDWATLVSGAFTVPFTIAAAVLPSGYGRAISGVMAVLALGYTCYRIWADERRQRIALEDHLAPRLKLEFDPRNPNFVLMTQTLWNVPMLFLRVLPRAASPTVNRCLGYLTRISRYENGNWITLYDESLPLPWSYEDSYPPVPKQLNHEVSAFLDVAFFAQDGVSFGIGSPTTPVPNRLSSIVEKQIAQHPEDSYRLDVIVTGDDSMNAEISLTLHLGRQWDRPQIGWLDSTGMIRVENSVSIEPTR